jgi:CRP-like cAMP-binding protein
MKTFLKNVLSKIPYLSPEYLNKHLYHTILYSLEQKYLPKGDILLKVSDDTTAVYIVTHGALEIYSEFEGNEFVIETL